MPEDIPRIRINAYGGVVQGVFADRPVEVLITDGDIDGVEDYELKTIEGEKFNAYIEIPDVDPKRIKANFDEVDG